MLLLLLFPAEAFLHSSSFLSAFTSHGEFSINLHMSHNIDNSYTRFSSLPEKLLLNASSYYHMSEISPPPFDIDPFVLVRQDLVPFTDNIQELVQTDHPVLSMAAKHFFSQKQGKKIRPTVCALMSRAVSNGNFEGTETYTKQAKLGQITEMIHVASLIHDDVLDEADTRRGGESIHKLYSNKVAVLAGDFLLARASVLLARLNDVNVVEIMATALDALVRGEIMQAKSEAADLVKLEYYLKKSYYKTASLIANSCKSCALLGGHSLNSDVTNTAEEYGYHMGLAFQIVDDILDFTVTSDLLGKPALADVSLGLATAPVLYASEEKPELKNMIQRRFSGKGDREKALELVLQTKGVQSAKELARFHAQRAVDAVSRLPQTEARDALIQLCHIVLTRRS